MNKTSLIICFLAITVCAQQKLVAIINTMDDEEPSVKISDLNHLTDRLREIAIETLPQKKYSVMTSQTILSLFRSPEDMVSKCNELAGCLVKIGREIAADYIGQARLGRFGDNLTIKVDLYESEKGTLVSSFTGTSREIYGLLYVLDDKAPEMFRRLPGVSSGMAASPSFAKSTSDIIDLENAVDMILDNDKRSKVKPNFEQSSNENTSFWAALALDVLGIGLLTYGVVKNEEAKDFHSEYMNLPNGSAQFGSAWRKADETRNARNTLYVIGSLTLAAGIGVHIWF